MDEYKNFLIFLKNYKKEIFVFLFLVLVVGVFYGNTLLNGFIHDDHGQIAQNFYIQKWKYWPKIFTGCIWEAALGDCKVSSYYRPVQSLSYLLTYQISPQPWFFHLINLFYFTLAAFLTFILVKLLTNNFFIALVSALFFAIHPLNAETVNWLATVPELTYTIFVLFSAIYWFKYRTEESNSSTKLGKYIFWPHNKNLYFSYLFFTLGLLAKEPAVFLPFILVLIDMTYFKKKISDFFLKKEFLSYAIFPIIFAIYIGFRFMVLGGLGAGLFYSVNNLQRIYAFVDLFADYLKKLVFPKPLNLFYEFNPSFNFSSLHFLLAFSIVSAFFTLFIASLIKKWRVISFSLLWILAFLSPALVFINSLGENVFSERYVFASSIGFALITAMVLEKLWTRGKVLKTIVLAMIITATIASFFTVFERNLLWRMDRLIYSDTLVKNPNADLIRYNLAVDLRDKNQLPLAKTLFEEVAKREKWKDVFKAYNNLGDIYRREKNFESAKKYFLKALGVNPSHKEAHNNLGAMQLEEGNVLKSLIYFCKALQIDPSFKDAKANFDRISGMIESVDDTNFIFLYQDILHGGTFIESTSTKTLVFQNKDCTLPQGCLYQFQARFDKNEFIFPFLIVGRTSNGEAVKMRHTSFNPEKSTIDLGIDHKFQNETMDFLLPTCDGLYYKGTNIQTSLDANKSLEPEEFH